LTLVTKTVFRTVGRSGLPGGKALRLVLDGCGEDGPSRVGIMVGEPEGMDQPVIHEGEPVAWISAGVTEAYDGCVLDLEAAHKGTPKGVGVAFGLPNARRDTRSYGHLPRGVLAQEDWR